MTTRAAILLLAVAGCSSGSPDEGSADAGPDASTDAGPLVTPPSPPAEPGAPLLTPCPAGWVELEGEVAACAPWTDRVECTGASARWPGAAGCEPIGSECPEGPFPEGLPAGADVLYVLAGAPEGGSGTEDDPYGTVTEALLHSPEDTIVAIGRGTYDEAVRVPGGVTLWGACVAETTLGGAALSPESAVVTSARDGTVVRNLRITGERVGVFLDGSRSGVLLEDVLVESTRSMGVAGYRGGQLVARHLVVRDTRPGPDGVGHGLVVSASTADLEGCAFERNREVGVGAFGAGAVLTLADVSVQDTLGGPDDGRGVGVMAQDGAVAEGQRVVVEGADGPALLAIGAGASLSLQDAVVRETRGRASGVGGRAASVDEGAELHLSRVLLEQSREVGAYAGGARLVLEDVVIRDTETQQVDGRGGHGVTVEDVAEGELTRVRVERSHGAGIILKGPGTTARVTDVVVEDIESDAAETNGVGIAVVDGAVVTVVRARVVESHASGIVVDGEGSALTAEDLSVRSTRSLTQSGRYGRGITAQNAARIELTRGLVGDSQEAGIAAVGPSTVVSLMDVEVADTLPQDCVEACGGFAGGIGVGGYSGARLDLERFRILRASLCGVQLARDGEIDLRDGEVAENAIGVNLQVDGYDLDRLTDRVAYRDNGQSFDSSVLALPELALPID